MHKLTQHYVANMQHTVDNGNPKDSMEISIWVNSVEMERESLWHSHRDLK